MLIADAGDPLTTQGNSTTLNVPGGLVQMTGFKQVTPDVADTSALPGNSVSSSAIDFVMATLDGWAR